MNTFEEALQIYLENYAQTDSEFAAKYANPDKNFAECCSYVLQEMERMAKELRNGRNAVGLYPSDETVCGLAVHYYDEADIEVTGPKSLYIATGADNPIAEVKPTPKPRTQKAPKKAPQPKHEIEVKDDDIEIPELDIPDFGFPIF